MEFRAFIEINQWEGETWKFYIPYDGNEMALERLRMHLEEAGVTDTYRVSTEEFSEAEVDTLVKHTPSGYMDAHNKLDGDLLTDKLCSLRGEDLDRALYKGHIADFMEPR